MLGLVCMLDGKGMKKGINSIKKFDVKKVKEAAIYNLNYTKKCIEYCIENNYFYRVSSSVIPYSDLWEWKKDKEILEYLSQIKKLSKKIRLTIHPDQFVILNSYKEDVIKNSMKILQEQVELAKYMGIENMIIHIGKKEGILKFKDTYKKLSNSIKNILTLENCHYYKVEEVLSLCNELKIPMTLDVHHGRITGSKDYNIEEIKKTWNGKTPLAHISSGKNFILDKAHSDYISLEDCEEFLWLFQKFDVEIEAKKKEKALEKITKYLNYNKNK